MPASLSFFLQSSSNQLLTTLSCLIFNNVFPVILVVLISKCVNAWQFALIYNNSLSFTSKSIILSLVILALCLVNSIRFFPLILFQPQISIFKRVNPSKYFSPSHETDVLLMFKYASCLQDLTPITTSLSNH